MDKYQQTEYVITYLITYESYLQLTVNILVTYSVDLFCNILAF